MSIRFRLTLLYCTILVLTLIVFGITLYTTQSRYTLDSLKRDMGVSGNALAQSIIGMYLDLGMQQPQLGPPPPRSFEKLSGEQSFMDLRERQMVRVLNADGTLVFSPFGSGDALPLSEAGLRTVQGGQVQWETVSLEGESLLVYNTPVVANGQVELIVQIARPLAERNRSLASLSRTLIITTLLATLIAFGIGWVMAGVTLSPIHRITQTAQIIGRESDFAQRVDYAGPNDEVGQLAKTFNSMLSRLQDAYQRVSQALRMQRDFVADVSHELRTPLTTVRGNLALLRRDQPLPVEEQDDILSDLVDESDRLIRLVNDLLVLARADARSNLLHEPVPVQPLVEEVCRQSRQLDQQRQIDEAVQDLTVVGDRDALKQVLLILLDNALKHSQGAILVKAEAVENGVEICISDNGPGIAPDALQHVFDRFYRGDIEPGVPGFGLGLSIAKSLIEGQGGTIAIESQLGRGSTVRIHLPRISVT